MEGGWEFIEKWEITPKHTPFHSPLTQKPSGALYGLKNETRSPYGDYKHALRADPWLSLWPGSSFLFTHWASHAIQKGSSVMPKHTLHLSLCFSLVPQLSMLFSFPLGEQQGMNASTFLIKLESLWGTGAEGLSMDVFESNDHHQTPVCCQPVV